MKALYFLANLQGLFTIVSSCCSNVSPSFPSQFSCSLQGVCQPAGEVSSSRICCVCVGTCRINKAVPVCWYFRNGVIKLDFGGTSCICSMALTLILYLDLMRHCSICEAEVLVLEHSCGAVLATRCPEMSLLGQQIQHSPACRAGMGEPYRTHSGTDCSQGRKFPLKYH